MSSFANSLIITIKFYFIGPFQRRSVFRTILQYLTLFNLLQNITQGV